MPGGSTESSLHFSVNYRSILLLVSKAAGFESPFRLLGRDGLVFWQSRLTAQTAIRAIVIHQRAGGRLVVCCRVWILVEKRCPVIGLRDASAAGVGRAVRLQRRRI